MSKCGPQQESIMSLGSSMASIGAIQGASVPQEAVEQMEDQTSTVKRTIVEINGNIETERSNRPRLEVEEIALIIELGEKAVSDKLHIDRGTFLELLRRSPFNNKHTGRPQFQISKERVIVNIIDKEDVPDLLRVKYLEMDGEKWPINVKIAERAPNIKFGVIKVHPEVPVSSIKADLLRNGINVDEVHRITKRSGPTYSVRLSFKDNVKPEKVVWGGQILTVFKYNPGVSICNKCSKGGHFAKNCNSTNAIKCPLCAGNHGKNECSLDGNADASRRKCANCGESGHGAADKVCPYFKNEQKIVAMMVELDVQRHEAKQLVRDFDRDLGNIQVNLGREPNSVTSQNDLTVGAIQTDGISSQNNHSSQAVQSVSSQDNVNSKKYKHIFPDKPRSGNSGKGAFPKSTSGFFRDAFAGSWADKLKGNMPKSSEDLGNAIETPQRNTKDIEVQTDLSGKQIEELQKPAGTNESESSKNFLNLAMILMKMMEIMTSNESMDSKQGKLASAIESTMKITLPVSCKPVSETPSSPILANKILASRRNLNSERIKDQHLRTPTHGDSLRERIRDQHLRTPTHIETIREMQDKEGNIINVHFGMDDSPTGLSQFVDGRYEEIRTNGVHQSELNEFLSQLTPSRNNVEEPMRSSWLLHP